MTTAEPIALECEDCGTQIDDLGGLCDRCARERDAEAKHEAAYEAAWGKILDTEAEAEEAEAEAEALDERITEAEAEIAELLAEIRELKALRRAPIRKAKRLRALAAKLTAEVLGDD